METSLDDNIFFLLVVNPAPRYRIMRHAIAWTALLWLIYRGFEFLSTSIIDQSGKSFYIYTSTLVFGGLIIGTYAIVAQLIQRFLLIRFQLGLFIGSLLIVHIISAELVLWHFNSFIQTIEMPQLPRLYARYADHITNLSAWKAPFDSVIVTLFSFSVFYNYLIYIVVLKVFKDLFSFRIRQSKLEKENLQLEFNFLKAQINPHFLFNTLNNIYSFSLKSPTRVSDTILKLADLMRYSLYETEEEFVLLSKELSFLDSYIQLERIRHDTDVQITYSIQGQAAQLMIPPLILIVFVENAFKHGVQSSAQASWVRVELVIEQSQLIFRVTNSLPKKPVQSIGGIGLKNVRKRLDHFFDGHHRLQVAKQADTFFVELIIDLHGPVIPSRHR